jgi:hypothetical protein
MYLLTFTYQSHYFAAVVFNFCFLMSCWCARLETKMKFLLYILSLWISAPTCPLLSFVLGLAFFRYWSANHFCCHSKVIWAVFCLPVLVWLPLVVSGHMKIHCNFSSMSMIPMILLKKRHGYPLVLQKLLGSYNLSRLDISRAWINYWCPRKEQTTTEQGSERNI